MQHTKMRRLVRVLKVPQYAAVGILESLWHLTAREAQFGDIGRLTDDDIADWIGWDRPSSELINGLVECGWLDRCEQSRLIVHDWEEHADDTTKKAIARQREKSVGKNPPNAPEIDAPAPSSGDVQTEPDKEPLPVPLPVPVPEPESNTTPLPPQAGGASHRAGPLRGETTKSSGNGKGAKPPDKSIADAAVARVLRECGLSEPRPGRGVSRAVRAAMDARLAKADPPAGGWTDEDFDLIAEQMAKAWRLFLEDADLMAYRVGAPKFFAEGWWFDRARWPYDPKLLANARRRL